MEARLTWSLLAALAPALLPIAVLAADPAAPPGPVATGGARIIPGGLRGAPVSGAVGPGQYVQLANGSMAVFDKASGKLVGEVSSLARLFAGQGSGQRERACARGTNGGALVYDHLAQHWVLAARSRAGNALCLATSDGPDATGHFQPRTWTLPAHAGPPALALARDGVLVTFALAGRGTRVCAVPRRSGAVLRCRDLARAGVVAAALLPQASLPPGTPALLLALGRGATLSLWRYRIDNNTVSQPSTVPLARFTLPCAGRRACIAQPLGGAPLPAHAGALAPGAVFDGRVLLVNHTVATADGRIGLRWYEIGTPLANGRLHQQGTHAPDAERRWMGSIGIDKAGNIALAYGVSSAATAPGIRYTGRLRGDPPGRMAQEETIVNGSGVQSSALGLAQPGGALSLDPVDGCTFWATHQFIQSSSAQAWQTRIAAFKFGECK